MVKSRRKSILLCAATRFESQNLLKGWQRSTSPGNKELSQPLVLITGIGPQAATVALSQFLGSSEGDGVDYVVCAGLGGALSPGVALGTEVWPEMVFEEQDNGRVLSLASGSETLLVPQGSSGLLLSCPRVVSAHKEGALLTERVRQAMKEVGQMESGSPAVIVDMETAAVLRLAKISRRRVLAARVISDTPEKPLPDFLVAAMAGKLGSSAKSLALNPKAPLQILMRVKIWSQGLQNLGRKLGENAIQLLS